MAETVSPYKLIKWEKPFTDTDSSGNPIAHIHLGKRKDKSGKVRLGYLFKVVKMLDTGMIFAYQHADDDKASLLYRGKPGTFREAENACYEFYNKHLAAHFDTPLIKLLEEKERKTISASKRTVTDFRAMFAGKGSDK